MHTEKLGSDVASIMYLWGETVIERRADVQYPREAVIPHNDLAPRSGTPNNLNIIAYLIMTQTSLKL